MKKTNEDLHADTNRLNIDVETKKDIYDIRDNVIKIGKKLVKVGRWLVEKTLWLASQYPRTTHGFILGAAISWLLASIPGAGLVLGPTLGTLALTVCVGAGALSDIWAKLNQSMGI